MYGSAFFGTSNTMSIARFKSANEIAENLSGGVVAIGNFDGVHRGHQAVLAKAIELARAESSSAVALTFEPHPRSFFNPDAPVFRLTDAAIKADLLGSMGFDGVYECGFNALLAAKSADDFVQSELIETLGAKHVVIGYDFHFGKNRQGSPDFLKDNAQRFGFHAHVIDKFGDESGDAVSSSRIRACLAEGDIAQANGLLGYSYRVRGEVVKGKQLGRTLGYPTANVILPTACELRHGVYAVRARLQNGDLMNGVASYGRRPTFDNGGAVLETNIFDFADEIYGQQLTIYFESFLRGEEKFDGPDALIAQMDKDKSEAFQYLSTIGPEQGLSPILAC